MIGHDGARISNDKASMRLSRYMTANMTTTDDDVDTCQYIIERQF